MNPLLERYKAAVNGWPKPINEDAVAKALLLYAAAIGAPQRKVFCVTSLTPGTPAAEALAALATPGANATHAAITEQSQALSAIFAEDARDAHGAVAALATKDARAAFTAYVFGDACAARDAIADRARAVLAAVATPPVSVSDRAAIYVFYWGYSWNIALHAVTAVGARQLADGKTEGQFAPLLDAVEAGAWIMVFLKDSIVWWPQPGITK